MGILLQTASLSAKLAVVHGVPVPALAADQPSPPPPARAAATTIVAAPAAAVVAVGAAAPDTALFLAPQIWPWVHLSSQSRHLLLSNASTESNPKKL